MRIKDSDIPTYRIDTNIYSLVSSFCTKDKEEALKAFARLYEMMKYHSKRYNVSFMLGLSNTNGQRAFKKQKRRRGNPKIKVLGKKVLYHAHAVIAGDKAEEFAAEIVRRRNKADGKRLTKKRIVKDLSPPSSVELYDSKGLEIVDYIYEQSESIRIYPKDGFDFKRFYGNFYLIEQK